MFNKFLFCFFVFIFCGCSEVVSKQEKNVVLHNKIKDDNLELVLFWNNFKQAILEQDTLKLDSMIIYPLNVRGIYDDDPIIIINNKREIINIFNFFFKNSDFSDFKNNKFDDIELKKMNKKWKIKLLYFNTNFFLEENKWDGEVIYKEKGRMESLRNPQDSASMQSE